MIVYRMTFDIAVSKDASDVYNLEREIIGAMRKHVCGVIGAEGLKNNAFRINGINASGMIDKQIKNGKVVAE